MPITRILSLEWRFEDDSQGISAWGFPHSRVSSGSIVGLRAH